MAVLRINKPFLLIFTVKWEKDEIRHSHNGKQQQKTFLRFNFRNPFDKAYMVALRNQTVICVFVFVFNAICTADMKMIMFH